MRRKTLSSAFILLAFIFTNVLSYAPSASAQSILAIGEIKPSGSVYIKSSKDQWVRIDKTYPLIQNSEIRTADGSAIIFYKDGSRVDLARDTRAVFSGVPVDYSIKLLEGFLRYNIKPPAYLSVLTPLTDNRIDNQQGRIRKVGCIWARGGEKTKDSEKDTETKIVRGKVLVDILAAHEKIIDSGESIFVGPDSKNKIYDHTLDTCDEIYAFLLPYTKGEKMLAGLIGAIFITTAYAFYSPSKFYPSGDLF